MAEGEVFVGNLPHNATEEEIKVHFSSAGQVHSINLITDRKGRSRCFGFIKIDNPEEVVAHLNQKEFQDRKLRVSRAIQKTEFQPRHQKYHRRGR
jgi:RNA recognition motif-containing protein